MTEEHLTREADSFFGVLKTKTKRKVKEKIADFVKKEDRLRESLKFQIMRAQNGEIHLQDVTLNGFISASGEKESEFKCEICGILLLGKDKCENHLRSEHFKQFKTLFAKECSLEAINHATYKKLF